MEITSAQNPKIKSLLVLQEKSRARKEQGLFIVEGRRELSHALSAGYRLHSLFLCPEILGEEAVAELITSADISEGSGKYFTVPASIYRKIAFREGTEGVVAEMECRSHTLVDLSLPADHAPLIVVLEAVEKPGNLGAVLRSADAAGADAVIICDPLTDLYNPNLIRSSIGAVFTVPVAAAPTGEVIPWLKNQGISILTAQLQDSSLYYDTPMTGPTAIVMGTESTGLTTPWREAADAHIRIPMLGRLDSLNVSVSAAILIYEALRQRLGSR